MNIEDLRDELQTLLDAAEVRDYRLDLPQMGKMVIDGAEVIPVTPAEAKLLAFLRDHFDKMAFLLWRDEMPLPETSHDPIRKLIYLERTDGFYYGAWSNGHFEAAYIGDEAGYWDGQRWWWAPIEAVRYRRGSYFTEAIQQTCRDLIAQGIEPSNEKILAALGK